MEFTGKVVIITGASSGIGATTAVKFASLDADLALVGRNTKNLTETAITCEKQRNRKPLVITADVSKDAKDIIDKTVEYFGRIDVLINNAGISTLRSFDDEMEEFDKIMATNLRAPFYISRLAMPHLAKTKGNIINVSSILSTKANSAMASYCMSKAALDMMTKCLALKCSKDGIRVNSINPGPVKTNIFRRSGISDDAQLFSAFEQSLPLKKMSDGKDIAELMAFLASDKAHYITGSHNVIDGGLLLGDDVPWTE